MLSREQKSVLDDILDTEWARAVEHLKGDLLDHTWNQGEALDYIFEQVRYSLNYAVIHDPRRQEPDRHIVLE
jgi:hypothetical protein